MATFELIRNEKYLKSQIENEIHVVELNGTYASIKVYILFFIYVSNKRENIVNIEK